MNLQKMSLGAYPQIMERRGSKVMIVWGTRNLSKDELDSSFPVEGRLGSRNPLEISLI